MPPSHQDTKMHKGNFKPLTSREEEIGKAIVDAAYIVHKALGPGLLEKVYEVCWCHVMKKKDYKVKRQVDIPIEFDGITFNEGLRLDAIVEDLVITEFKAVDEVNPVWKAQLLSHLKLTNKRLGFLINFNVSLIKNGITRMVL